MYAVSWPCLCVRVVLLGPLRWIYFSFSWEHCGGQTIFTNTRTHTPPCNTISVCVTRRRRLTFSFKGLGVGRTNALEPIAFIVHQAHNDYGTCGICILFHEPGGFCPSGGHAAAGRSACRVNDTALEKCVCVVRETHNATRIPNDVRIYCEVSR